MRITQRYTYRGGPLDGQTAAPTARRGQGYTLFRDASGGVLRPESGDRYGRAEMAKRPHPGWYTRDEMTSLDRDTLIESGVYVWKPAREKDVA